MWFREEQRLNPGFLLLTVLVALAVCVGSAIGLAHGASRQTWWVLVPVWLFAGLALPVLVALARLTVEVHADAVVVRYRPFFVRRHIPLDRIASVEAVTCRPVREDGGFGIRGLGHRRASEARGDRGVQLVLTDGRRVLLGSQVPEQLASAVRRARGPVGS